MWEATAGVRGSGVDAHFFSGRAIAFLRPFSARFESHKRFGTPPLSTDVHVYVHDNSEFNSFGKNAYAVVDPVKGDTLHFGDGEHPLVQNALPTSAAYDVVAHEMAHLVIAHTSELVNAYPRGCIRAGTRSCAFSTRRMQASR